jgi:hypothetical protein
MDASAPLTTRRRASYDTLQVPIEVVRSSDLGQEASPVEFQNSSDMEQLAQVTRAFIFTTATAS